MGPEIPKMRIDVNLRTICKICRLCIFVLVFAFLFHLSSNILINKIVDGNVPDQHEMIPGFYKETPGSLDVVCLGASSLYDFYQAPIGWNSSGIAAYSYASASQPTAAIPFLIEEVKKTQPQALIVASLNQLVVETASKEVLHYLVDFMPFSATKIDMINYLYDSGFVADTEGKLAYFFPIIQYHSRWNELIWQDIHYVETGGVKGAKKFDHFLNDVLDVTENDIDVNCAEGLTERESKTLKDVLDYCDSHNVDILFLITPQYIGEEGRDAKYLAAQEYIEKRGYPVLNLKKYILELGLDLKSDFADVKHTNIHGSIKVSNYICSYLTEHYGFADKRGNPAYVSWDEAWDRYREIIKPYLTEDELKQLHLE